MASLVDERPTFRRPVRSTHNKVLAGVAGGLGHQLRLDPVLIRVAFLVLSLANGAGVLLYLLLWAVSHQVEDGPTETRSGTRQIAAVACITAGSLILLRAAGWWWSDALAWPLGVAALGSTFVWSRSGEEERLRWMGLSSGTLFGGPASILRLLIGVGLVVGGTAALLNRYSTVSLKEGAVPIVVAVAGLLLALGPWVLRLTRQVSDERRERIRSEERSNVAAHLHDSVLQTLAMIQRTGSHQDVVTLARRQERELRAWLYGKEVPPGQETVRAAVERVAARFEDLHRIPVEVVVVGDADVDEAAGALVQAVGEAINNAGLHSHASAISVYLEVEPDAVTAFVRDEGKGFDPSIVPPDRRGIADSIVGRMARHGGRVEITSEVGSGTEVKIVLPRSKK
jgi:signal transduction histidine kinase